MNFFSIAKSWFRLGRFEPNVSGLRGFAPNLSKPNVGSTNYVWKRCWASEKTLFFTKPSTMLVFVFFGAAWPGFDKNAPKCRSPLKTRYRFLGVFFWASQFWRFLSKPSAGKKKKRFGFSVSNPGFAVCFSAKILSVGLRNFGAISLGSKTVF